MDARECMLTRRSIRTYRPDPIPDQVLERILEAAVHAPSAVNLQPWHFVVLRTPERMEEYRGLMRQGQHTLRPSLEARFRDHPEVVKETETFHTTLGGASACVLAFLLKDYPDRDGVLESLSAAMENLLLAAWAEGVGSCWVRAAQHMGLGPTLQERFAPGKGEFVAAVTLGWPDQTPKLPPRREGRYVFL